MKMSEGNTRALILNAAHRLRTKRFKKGIPEGCYNHYTNFRGRYSAVGTIVKETTKCADVDIIHNVSEVLPQAAAEIIQVLDTEGFEWDDIADLLETFYMLED